MFTITITVPDSSSLIPLERAIRDYSEKRKESPDSLIRYWATVMMPNILEQIENQRQGQE